MVKILTVAAFVALCTPGIADPIGGPLEYGVGPSSMPLTSIMAKSGVNRPAKVSEDYRRAVCDIARLEGFEFQHLGDQSPSSTIVTLGYDDGMLNFDCAAGALRGGAVADGTSGDDVICTVWPSGNLHCICPRVASQSRASTPIPPQESNRARIEVYDGTVLGIAMEICESKRVIGPSGEPLAFPADWRSCEKIKDRWDAKGKADQEADRQKHDQWREKVEREHHALVDMVAGDGQ